MTNDEPRMNEPMNNDESMNNDFRAEAHLRHFP